MNELIENGIVKEISSDVDGFEVKVPIASDIKVEELISGDSDPLFVTVEVLNNSISRNRRIWDEDTIKDVAQQIMDKKPDGYKGHLKDSDRDSVAPKAMTIWIGSVIKKIQGRTRLFAKGYILPSAVEFKEYLRKAKSAAKKATVSVYGQASQKWNESKKAYDILKFDLESIDWARPGSEGVPGLGYFSLASEMKGEIMEREEILKTVTLSEMKSNNEKVYEEIKAEGIKETKDSVVKEMEEKVTAVKEMVEKFEEAMPEEAEKTPEVLSEMVKSHKGMVDSYLDSKLAEKIDSESVRAVVKRQVVSEMTGKFMTKELVDSTIDSTMATDEVKGILQEMAKQSILNPGTDNRLEEKVSRFIKK